MTPESLLMSALKPILSYVTKKILSSLDTSESDFNGVYEGIEKHLLEANQWSSQVQFLGMSTPQGLDDSTIKLGLHTEPRKFRGKENKENIRSEEDLIKESGHFVLLGDPGSGKTTTLKRITRRILTTEQESTDYYQYPIVIRLRELKSGASLYTTIANILHLKYTQEEVKRIIKTHKGASYSTKHIETRIGNSIIEDIIPDILNKTSAILILDGLDEIKSEFRDLIREEIVSLGRKMNASKIIVSFRSGEYVVNIEGFKILEICPLTAEQIVDIATKWLGDATEFLKSLKALPYADIADRPILLTQLLFLYDRYGYLPEQPSNVYKRVIRLLLEEWDAQRNIIRLSKYAGFDPERKAEFLAALSYHLTYTLEEKRFTETDLLNAYQRVYDNFDLNGKEALQVVGEIQTHTGIIVASPDETYEFSHLSLQEYLCASYLVRAPILSEITNKIASYTAPLAVAVALSSKPASWLANILLSPGSLKALGPEGVISLLSRVITESPFFEESEQLAFAIFNLYDTFNAPKYDKVRTIIEDFLRMKNILKSMASALRWYMVTEATGDYFEFRMDDSFINPYEFSLPQYGKLPINIFQEVFNLKTNDFYYLEGWTKKILTNNKISALATLKKK
jgi:hypothetical protein